MALLNTLEKKCPTNGSIYTIKGRVSVVKNEDRELPIRECGPYFKKYEKQIEENNADFFTKKENLVEMNTLSTENENYEMIMSIFDAIRDCYFKMKKLEFLPIWTKVKDMLHAYIKWAGLSSGPEQPQLEPLPADVQMPTTNAGPAPADPSADIEKAAIGMRMRLGNVKRRVAK